MSAAPTSQVLNDRYEILRPLGHGGMGAVYLVFDRQVGRQVALKSFPPMARRVEDLAHFEHEFLTLSRLRHPNVAEVYDFGVIEGTHDVFFTSELIAGKDLFEVTADLSELDLARLIVQVCRGLSYIHSRQIIHYDIKPTNILVTAGDPPLLKLIDFGLAEQRVDDALGVIKGTVSYLAPEVARHLPVDHRADLYSLGVTIYHCVTRGLPFRGETNLDVVRKVVSDAPPDPAVIRPDLSRGLRDLILRLMSKDPGARHQSGNEVIRALSRLYGQDFAVEPREAALTFVTSGGFFGREAQFSALTGAFDEVFSWHDPADPLAALPPVDQKKATPSTAASATGFVITSSAGAFGFDLGRRDSSVDLSGLEAAEAAPPPPPAPPGRPLRHLFLVSGEAGVGKSRLLRELKTYAQLRRAAVVEGRATPAGGAYAAFVEVFRGILGLWLPEPGPDGQGAAPRPRQNDPLRRRLLQRYGAELVRLIPDLDSSALPVTPRTPLSPEQDERRLHDALAQFMIGYSRSRPLVVLLHDLEHADVETLELLRYLTRNLGVIESTRAMARQAGLGREPLPLRLLVVGAYRPSDVDGPRAELLAALAAEPVSEALALEPLGPQAVYTLIESMLGVGSDPRALAERIYRETGGNPYFAVEVMRALVEQGALQRDGDGGWRLDLARDGALEVPASVAEVILERTRRISPEERGPLELLATLGRPAAIHELAALSGADTRDLVARLGALERREVVRAERAEGGGGRRYDFIHDVARQAVYEAIPRDARIALHARCGEFLEGRAGLGYGAVDAGELARHFSAAGDRKRALEYGIRAGDDARAVHANHLAIELYHAAMALVPVGSARWRALLQQVGDLLLHTGEYGRAAEAYERVLAPDVARQLAPAELVRAHRRRAEVLERRGDLDGALDDLSAASAATFATEGLEREGAALLAATASIYCRLGRYQDAVGFCQVGLAQLVGLPEGEEAAQVRTVLGRAHLALGNLAEAEREFEHALAARRRQGDEPGVARTLADLGAVALEQGRFQEAADRFERALERESAIGHAAGVAEAATRLAAACRALGELERAASLLRRALGIHERSGARAEAATVLAELGRLHLASGDHARALEHLRRAGEEAGRLGLLAVSAAAKTAEAQALVLLGAPERAHDLAGEALRQASLQGDAPRERAAALEALGLVHAAHGEVDRAEQLLHEAQALFRAQEDAGGVARTTIAVVELLLARGDDALAAAALATLDHAPLPVEERPRLALARARAALASAPPPPAAALEAVEQALQLARRRVDRERLWQLLAARGRLRERGGDPTGALDSFVEAMTALRDLLDLVPPELRQSFVRAPERVACREDFLRLKAAQA
ncbi:MAG: tetratricopeptide repeat protein [Planctomycetes bacterium]|nr:tetratricopeptide repeat protein [Planctomycetota bacterium]